MPNISVNCLEKAISVDGVAYVIEDAPYPAWVHSIYWTGKSGFLEKMDGSQQEIDEADYPKFITPLLKRFSAYVDTLQPPVVPLLCHTETPVDFALPAGIELWEHVTMVPVDNLIACGNGDVATALVFPFAMPEGFSPFHALQWHNGHGHIETPEGEICLTLADYETKVLPFVALWKAEKASLEAKAAQEKAEAEALYNSTEERAKRLRAERQTRLDATQWLVERHREELEGGLATTLSAESYAALLAYRQALREFPDVEGFPWAGDVENAPWPVFSL